MKACLFASLLLFAGISMAAEEPSTLDKILFAECPDSCCPWCN